MKVTRVVTGDEPVALPEMKQYLRVMHNEEDADIERLITHARHELEMATGRSLVAQDIELEVEIDGEYTLPFAPVTVITDITLNDEDYTEEKIKGIGTLNVTYEAGPYECVFAVKEFVAHMYMNKGAGDHPKSVKNWMLNNTLNLWLQ